MGHDEVLNDRIRSMMYKYQSQLVNPNKELEVDSVLNSIIDDLIELSGIVRSSQF